MLIVYAAKHIFKRQVYVRGVSHGIGQQIMLLPGLSAMLKGRSEIFATFSVTQCKATWLKFHQILLVILLVTQ